MQEGTVSTHPRQAARLRAGLLAAAAAVLALLVAGVQRRLAPGEVACQ